IASSHDDHASELQLLQLFRALRCDPLQDASCLPHGDESYRDQQLKGTPIIPIDREMNPGGFCSVVSDNHDARLQLTRSLRK
ncbi:catabolite repressor/activator, partial [Pseudomonas syringae pv. tagetis]